MLSSAEGTSDSEEVDSDNPAEEERSAILPWKLRRRAGDGESTNRYSQEGVIGPYLSRRRTSLNLLSLASAGGGWRSRNSPSVRQLGGGRRLSLSLRAAVVVSWHA